ncbi:MAG: hypothetical protein GY723_11165 [bacterium]|nr:hypothetical protein [bacterium]
MLTGFNTNIRHRGVLFHVQSEDSGRDHPHVITHLFHGGNIMATEKSSYAEKVDDRDLEGVVRAIMQSQHKAVLKRLRAGAFDDAILSRLGSDAFDGADGSQADPESGLATEPPFDPAADGATEPPVDTAADGATEPPVDIAAETGATATAHRQPDFESAAPPAEASAAAAADVPSEPDAGRPFGDAIVSDKPLDEVILNYLVSNARKRKRQPTS